MSITIQPKHWNFKLSTGVEVDWGHPLARSLTAAFLFNEGGGVNVVNAAHTSENLKPGTAPPWVVARDGVALDFAQASSHYLTTPSKTALQLDAPLTVMAFVRPDSVTTFQWIVDKGTGNSNQEYLLGTDTGSKARYISRNAANLVVGGTVLVAGNYYQITATESLSAVRLYLDGIFESSDALFGSPSPNSTALNIGARDSGGITEHFDGVISEVYLWKRALSQPEIRWLKAERYAMFVNPQRFWVSAAAAAKGVGPFTELSVTALPGMIHAFLAKDPAGAAGDVFFENRHPIEQGMKPQTAAGLGGVLID